MPNAFKFNSVTGNCTPGFFPPPSYVNQPGAVKVYNPEGDNIYTALNCKLKGKRLNHPTRFDLMLMFSRETFAH